MSRGTVAYTLLLRYPHRKKSQGVKPGDLGGHSLGQCKAIILCLKKSIIQVLTSTEVCGGAPSWAHHRREKLPLAN